MKIVWTVLIAVAALVCGVILGVVAHRMALAEAPAASQPAAEEAPPPGHLKLTADQVKNAGVEFEQVKKSTQADEIQLFGEIQEDPEEVFSVRADAAGTVIAGDGKKWPEIGDQLADGAVIGAIEPRITASDQITLAAQKVTLQTQVASAQADVNTANAALAEAKASYDRLKALNEQDKNVSDRAVEEALAKEKTEEAHATGAQKTLEFATTALQAVDMKMAPVPLTVAHGGEVIDLPGHPGESVESGQELVKVARFDHVVAALDVPPMETVDPSAKEARIVTVGEDKTPLQGERLGTAATTDPKTRNQVILFRVAAGNRALRPGAAVLGYIARPGSPLQGVAIPESAVVRYQGKAWVYLASSTENEFDRKEVTLDHPLPDGTGWFITEGLKGDERVVTHGAAAMLSTELTPVGGGD